MSVSSPESRPTSRKVPGRAADGWTRRLRGGLSFGELRATLLTIAVATAACLLPAQSDTYWHLRAGAELFATGRVPLVETYSHTARGLPWPNHEWLWQAISYGLFHLGGMPLLTAFGAALATGAFALAFRLAGPRTGVAFVLAAVAAPLASLVWALRPQVASLALLMLLLTCLAERRHRPIPLLFVLWANVHGAVALGGVLMLAATALAWLHDRVVFRRLAALTLVSGLLTAATPMGTGLWRFIGESMARSRQNQILEWMPSYPTGPATIAFWLAATILLTLAVLRWRRLGGHGRAADPSAPGADRLLVVAALVFIPLAARAVRNISPFLLLWIPAMARLLAAGRPAPTASAPPAPSAAPVPPPPSVGPASQGRPRERPHLNLAIAGLAATAALVAVTLCWRAPLDQLGWQPIPPAAVTAVRACPGPLYNRYNEGGVLLWFVPTVPVFIDSRQDPYPADLLAAHAEAERTGEYQALFARHQIRCAAVPPSSKVGVRLLSDGWTAAHRDDTWLVLYPPERTAAPASPHSHQIPLTD